MMSVPENLFLASKQKVSLALANIDKVRLRFWNPESETKKAGENRMVIDEISPLKNSFLLNFYSSFWLLRALMALYKMENKSCNR